MSKVMRRPLPLLTESNRFFWTSGEDGKLRFLRCSDCANYIHPPVPICDQCLSMQQEVAVVSGRATLAAVTVNHQMWMPMIEPPYVIALVEIQEQSSLRLTTNIVQCDESELWIGMPLQVTFEHYEDVYLPVFRPVTEPAGKDSGTQVPGASAGEVK